MIIKRIYIRGFGKLKDLHMELSDGINIITGPNEAGKSTLHLFIRSMLYGAGKHRRGSDRPVWERMRPWHDENEYGGSIDIEKDGKGWRIERDFDKSADDLSITDIESGARLAEAEHEAFMKELLNELSETAYANTVSAGQLQTAAGRDMAAEIRRYAANVSSALDPSLSADGALSYLEKKKSRESELIDDNALRDYNRVLTHIKELENELRDPRKNNLIRKIKRAGSEAEEMAEDTAIRLGDNELTISGYNAELVESGLKSTEDIDRLEQETRKAYALYNEEKKVLPVYTAAAVMGLIIGAVGIISVFNDIFGIKGFIGDHFYIQLAVSAAVLVCGMAALIRALGLRQRKNSDEEKIIRILERHLGESVAVGSDDRSMEAFANKIADYREIAARLTAAREQRDSLVSRLQTLNDEQRRYSLELEEQQKIKSGVDDILRELISLRARAVQLKKKISANEKHRDEIDAMDMACDTISQLAERIKEAAGTYVNREAGEMLKGFTAGRYDSISAGADLDIRLNSRDGMISVGELSQGTADQVYMALRLAAIRFISGGEDIIPLVLDDSFAQYDDERLLTALRFLAENYHGQIVIFTCQSREERVLEGTGIEHRSITLSA